MLSWAKIVGFILIILAVSILGAYSYMYSNSSNRSYSEATATDSQTLKGYVETIVEPPSKFYGPTFTEEAPGLKVIATLSNSSVRVGETLWINVKFVGEKACSIILARITVTNSRGQKVHDVYVWLPHRTLAPGAERLQEESYMFTWKTSKDPSANVEVTPDDYTFLIKVKVDENEVTVKGTVKVVGQ